jgi:hypothetical protein
MAVSALDNISVTKNENYIICFRINGLLDHDANIIELNNFNIQEQYYNKTQIIGNFNECIITDFKTKLSFETWDDIFEGNDVNAVFNNFLHTYLRKYSSSTKI